MRRLGVVGGVAILAVIAGTAMFGDARGGRPFARVDIAAAPVLRDPPAPASPDPKGAAPERGRRDAESLEAASGVSVVRPAGTTAPGSIIVQVPSEVTSALSPSPDGRLVEATRHGLLPRIGLDGAAPADVYRRRPGDLPGGAQPLGRVAIVVGGLGISRGATEEAIARLPEPVSLAFAPYGPDLEREVGRARGAGHEVLLQIPMEPFDTQAGDPGPHTLTTSAPAAENLDRLHWALGRFTGYVGLMNYMGAKLTADERALVPILREAGRRGLGVVDDGSSSRSLVAALAGETRAARADIVLDAVPRPDLIDKALAAVEKQAVASGRIAVATASAMPVTVERIARWAEGLEARGILLVPVSAALATKPRESARR